ncbi:MAG: ABC transporter ATP-binding protein [Actinomycetota bacterium]|nr:ABC transporter ATP-binding protein [Actinomycetota bacterium]
MTRSDVPDGAPGPRHQRTSAEPTGDRPVTPPRSHDVTTVEPSPPSPPSSTPPAATPSSEPTIRVEGVTRRFGAHRAVEDLDLDIEQGTIIGIVGPSGCGKSTLVRLLLGIDRPTEGTVRVFGGDPTRSDAAGRRRVGYVPQVPVLYPNLTIWRNLNLVASLYGLPVRRRRRRMRDLLRFVDLDERRRTKMADASGGMQRRLTLIAALVHDPELIFLDEPTAGLDPILRSRIWERLTTMRNQGRTLVVTTQLVAEAAHCDRVAVMADGRLVTVDTPTGLRRQAYDGEVVDISTHARMPPTALEEVLALDQVVDGGARSWEGTSLRFVTHGDDALDRILDVLARHDVVVDRAGVVVPDLDDVFVRLVERRSRNQPLPRVLARTTGEPDGTIDDEQLAAIVADRDLDIDEKRRSRSEAVDGRDEGAPDGTDGEPDHRDPATDGEP